MRMKKVVSVFLCMVMVVTMMSGIGPMIDVQAADGTDFFTEKDEVTNYAYSFAVVGDTQIVTEYDVNNSTSYLSAIYDWILNNKDTKNIEYVFGLGDITDNNKEAEWSLAQTQISKLNGKIPYSLVRGNHDLVGYGSAEDKTVDYFTKYLGTEEYKNQFEEGGFYSEENIWNSWRTFTVGDVDYLMLALDWGASDAVLSWAGNIISEHSRYNVIITTHGYAYSDGTTVGAGEGGMSTVDNNGEAMWKKFVSKYENIVLVMSGHVPCEDIVVSQDEGVNGNVVTSVLVDPQDVDAEEVSSGNIPLGAVAMLYFSEDGTDVQVEYYATARNAYYKENNQFSFELASISKEVDDCESVVKEYTATEVSDYLAKEGEDGYPKLDGYLFAGWFTKEQCDASCALAGKTPTETTYALFVPKHMLSVKAQISGNLIDSNTTNDTTGSIRFITTIDSLAYKEAGFDISYVNEEGNTVSTTTGSKKALRKLYVLDSTEKWAKTPEGTFCGVSKYFKACLLKNVSMEKHYNTVFILKPYFITLDGDKVYGEPAEKSFKQGCEDSKVAINVQECEHGTVTATENVHWGNTVTLTVSPESDAYLCESLMVNGWDVADELVANGDGTYSYSFTAMEGSYTVVPKISRRIFAESTTWDMSKQFEGEVSRTTTDGKTMASAVLYDQYTDIDITLKDVKHRDHYDSTKTFGGRMDIMFQFDVDGDGKYTTSTDTVTSVDKNTSFGIMTTEAATGTTKVRTLGVNDNQWVTTSRAKDLYTLSDEEVTQYKGDGIEFRVIRSGTMAYVYLNDKQVVEFDLTQNNSGVTAETKAIVTLRYYEGVGEVVVPFEISDTVDPVFTTTGATGTWDLTNKYNGVVTVDSTSVGNVVLPLAKKYTDIDMTLSGVKEYSSLHTVDDETKYSRTDILFEFDTNGDGTTDKTTSFGIVKDGTNGAAVKTLGIDKKFITVNRANTLYSLDAEEAAKYNDLEQGVELRVVRSGKYIYVFVEGKQVSEFDITQNDSGVTADMEATVSLRHYDVKTSGLSFTYDVTDKVEETSLSIATNENGTVATNQVSHLDGTTVVWENSTKHFMGETITLTATPSDNAYICTSLKINEQEADIVTNDDGTYGYSFKMLENSYTIVPEFTRRIFVDSTTWDVSKQFEGVVSLPGGGTKTVSFYDQYTDIDLTLKDVKHQDYTADAGGRTDVLFEFDTDGDGTADKSASFGLLYRGEDEGVAVEMLAVNGTSITSRFARLYFLDDETEEKLYYNGGIDLRIIRSGTDVYIYLENKQVYVYDLTQNTSGVTADMPATVKLRYYDGTGDVILPFEISDTVDPIFTTTGATGTWDLTNKYNGVVTVDSTSVGNVVLPLAKKYTDIDMTLSGVKEYSSLHTVDDETKYSRTDILFEFDTNGDGTTDKTTSFGIVKDGTNGAAVKTLGIDKKFITVNRANTLYSLDAEEAAKYNDLEQGVELRVVRSGKYIYVFVEGKQVSEFDITQNDSGVTADMEATVSLRHYDVKTSGLSFTYDVTDKVEETSLSIASNENGTVATNKVSHLDGTTVVLENSTKHFMGETITLTATPNRGYKCANLQINNKKVEQDNYTFMATKDNYFIEAEYERRVFADSNTWDVSRQAEGIVTLLGGGTASLPFYDEYTDIDLTLMNVKEYDSTGNTPGRTDVRFEFDIDGDGVFDKNTSFGVMTRDDGYTKVMTLGNDDNKWITTSRAVALYTLTDEEATAYKGDGITFRIVRFGTDVDICINGKVVAEFDLTQNESGITADMPATVTLRHYDATTDGEVVIPFEVSDVADTIFTKEGAAGTWDLAEKYNGVVSVDSTSIASVVLPFAKRYTDIDLTLNNVKHRDNNVSSEATYGSRTDILFEFNTDGDEDNVTDKTVSFGVMRRSDGQTWVRTLGIDKKTITTTRVYELYQLDETEVEKYNGDGIDFRVVRLGAYIYVFVEGKQVAEFDVTQNQSGVTANMEAKVSLRHYDVKAEAIEFSFTVTEDVEEVTLDTASNEGGTVAAQTISNVANDNKTTQISTTHFMGETIVLTVTPSEGYKCTKLLVNGRSVTLDNLTYALLTERKTYTIEAAYEQE